MSEGKIQLQDWDLSDPWERYELASLISPAYHKRMAWSLIFSLAAWAFVSSMVAGVYFQSNPWWYIWTPSAPYRIRFGLEVVPFAVIGFLIWIFSYGLWALRDAPSEQQIRAMYAAAEQVEAVYGNADD